MFVRSWTGWLHEEAKMDEQAKVSRRSMLRGMALLASGTLVAGVIHVKPAYAQKIARTGRAAAAGPATKGMAANY
jgi:hypothetical protein